MTLAQNYWLLLKLWLARWHDRRYRANIDEIEVSLREAGYLP